MHTPRNIQSPYTSTDFWNNFASETPRMAVFMKVTPALSTGLSTIGLTSNTRDMTLAGHTGVTFKSAAGLMPSSFEEAMGDPTTLEMTGIFDSVLFDRDQVIAGLWENASVEIFIRSWDSTAVNYGELLIFRGFLGEFRDYQLYFKAEGRGLLSKLSQNAVWVTSRACRVKKFRDSQCGHTASTVTVDGATWNIVQTGKQIGEVSVGARRRSCLLDTSTLSGTVPTSGNLTTYCNQLRNGVMTVTAGNNTGVSREILSAEEATGGFPYIQINFKRPFPFDLETGDTVTMTFGCNRTVEDCKKYDNIINFRGEPYVPGLTTISKVPSSDETV